jgi:hypothetical protein
MSAVQIRLIGTRVDVAAILRLLDDAATLTDVSDPRPSHSKQRPGVLVYATVSRTFPLTGGTR